MPQCNIVVQMRHSTHYTK